MVVLLAGAVLSRNLIRAHWWTHRLSRTESVEKRQIYVQCLASLGDRAVGPVSKLLESDEAELRSMALKVLHYARGERALQLILRASHDPDEQVRRAAVRGLVVRGDERAVSELASIAAAGEERTAMMATAGLRGVASDVAKSALIDLLTSSPHPGVRIEAIDGLAALRAKEAIEPLIDALADSAVFEGMTEGDIEAKRAIQSVKDSLARDFGLAEDVKLALPDRRVVGETAARALSAITGHSFDDDPELAADSAGLQEAWRKWCALRRHPDTDKAKTP
jgi:HEAT repeat protein